MVYDIPEWRYKYLWGKVIERAQLDANGTDLMIEGPSREIRREAITWLTEDSEDLEIICEWAGCEGRFNYRNLIQLCRRKYRDCVQTCSGRERNNGRVLQADKHYSVETRRCDALGTDEGDGICSGDSGEGTE